MLTRHRQSPRTRGLVSTPSTGVARSRTLRPQSPSRSPAATLPLPAVLGEPRVPHEAPKPHEGSDGLAEETNLPRDRAAQDAARRAAAARERSGAQRRAARTSAPARLPSKRERAGREDASMAALNQERNRRGAETAARTGRFSQHPLTDAHANQRLFDYESSVKGAFDRIVPVLRQVAAMQCEPRFEERATDLIRAELGYDLPREEIEHAWVQGVDMRRLFAMSVFKTYRRISDDFFASDPLGGRETHAFESLLQDCGFHLLDVTPCADGRLAHAISYVLRLPYAAVRRKSYAGSLFDVENTVQKWAETEMRRFREGRPNLADAPTRYLKTLIYHFSSVDPAHQGCAAHGSDDNLAARAGLERLEAFKQAIENSYCCGASVDLLLLGLDTDTDAIRVHIPDGDSRIDLSRWVDGKKLYEITRGMAPEQARAHILELVRAHALERTRVQSSGQQSDKPATPTADGMLRFVARLIENNISQIDYVRAYHQGGYADIGHAERFIGAGIGFEEIQLRNLTYFAYLATVEEGAADVDVGVKIFSGLNVSRGLPVPVVVRYDYHGGVPGARERAVAHCERIAAALKARFPKLCADGMLHCLRAVRDCDAGAAIEIVGCSLQAPAAAAH